MTETKTISQAIKAFEAIAGPPKDRIEPWAKDLLRAGSYAVFTITLPDGAPSVFGYFRVEDCPEELPAGYAYGTSFIEGSPEGHLTVIHRSMFFIPISEHQFNTAKHGGFRMSASHVQSIIGIGRGGDA